jgi:hypothetical protein
MVLLVRVVIMERNVNKKTSLRMIMRMHLIDCATVTLNYVDSMLMNMKISTLRITESEAVGLT